MSQSSAEIPVVIFCGGLGSRLRQETELRPKPMVEIGGRPILWHIMKLYAHYGHRRFVLPLGYKGEVIKQYFYHYSLLSHDVTVRLGRNRGVEIHNNGDEGDWSITLVETGENTLKGGRLKRVAPYLPGDRFMVTYGDGVADIDIDALLRFHQSHGRLATLTGVRPPSLFGELRIEDGKASLFVEKPQTSTGVINGGFFVFERAVLDYLTDAEDCDFETGPLERLAAEGNLMVYGHHGTWACMDTFRDVQYLNRLWAQKQAFWNMWK